jgi:hypothetical protein
MHMRMQCIHTVEAGGDVDSLLLAGGFLFVGVLKAGEGIIKIWDMATGASHQLPGHRVSADREREGRFFACLNRQPMF